MTCRLLSIGILSSIRSQRHKLFSWLATRGFFEKIASHNAGVTSTQFKSRVIRLCNCSPWHYRASAIDRWVACEIPAAPNDGEGRRIYFSKKAIARRLLWVKNTWKFYERLKNSYNSGTRCCHEVAPADACMRRSARDGRCIFILQIARWFMMHKEGVKNGCVCDMIKINLWSYHMESLKVLLFHDIIYHTYYDMNIVILTQFYWYS